MALGVIDVYRHEFGTYKAITKCLLRYIGNKYSAKTTASGDSFSLTVAPVRIDLATCLVIGPVVLWKEQGGVFSSRRQ